MNNFSVKGIPISEGISVGEIFVLENEIQITPKKFAGQRRYNAEVVRLEAGLAKTLTEVSNFKHELDKNISDHDRHIFDAYKLMLQDEYFIQEIKEIIKGQKCPAEAAVHICMQRYVEPILNSGNEYAIERVYDLYDIEYRLVKNITGEQPFTDECIEDGKIIVINEITPSMAVRLGKKNTLGIAAGKGAGYLSHTAIILRGLGIPAVNGIDFEEAKKYNRHMAVIDGYEGNLTAKLDENELEKYNEIVAAGNEKKEQIASQKMKPAVTTDGHSIRVSANVSNLKEFYGAWEKDMDGIGLVRTEMLFIDNKRMPDEKRQFSIYNKIARLMYPKPVTIRTADLGDDKMFEGVSKKERLINSGARGLEYSLETREQFLIQIRAILRATQVGNVSITFPMVNTAQQLRDAKELIEIAVGQLRHEGEKDVQGISIGAFIETGYGLANLGEILNEVDFISMGTNDLLQQTMGINRITSVDRKGDYLQPEFLKLLQYCINRVNLQNKQLSVCGEMASDPAAAVLLMGMGAGNLSMLPSKAFGVSSAIRKTSFEKARELSNTAMEYNGVEEVKELMSDWFRMG